MAPVAPVSPLGDLYANRESVVAGQTFGINPTAQALLQAYRPYRV
ncbi:MULTISPECIES: head-tail connector protein [Brevundimonas]|nr:MULTISPECIES: head-tail connector protein [Brevundimonas]